MTPSNLIRDILCARYPGGANALLERYVDEYGLTPRSIEVLCDEVQLALGAPVSWEGYELPSVLRKNTQFFQQATWRALVGLRFTPPISLTQLQDFFLVNHQTIKYGVQRWLLANAGLALEQFVITPEMVEPVFFEKASATRGADWR